MQFSSTPERNRHITERSVILGRFTVYATIKSPYSHGGNPHRITQSLIAILAGLQIPFLCSETHELEGRNLGNPGSPAGNPGYRQATEIGENSEDPVCQKVTNC